MTEEQRCKKTALERLEDALALYENERYAATLYMCGYVIENGIKYELHKLANTKLEDVKHKSGSIINHLFKNDSFKDGKDEELTKWMDEFYFPVTIFDFIKFINNLLLLSSQKNKQAIYNRMHDSNEFYVILLNRQKPFKNDNNSSTFHNITGFLKSLNEWRVAAGFSDFLITDYGIDEKLRWSTNIRYGENFSTNDINDEENAKESLKIAINFLKEVASIDVLEYENRLNQSNESEHDNIEKEY